MKRLLIIPVLLFSLLLIWCWKESTSGSVNVWAESEVNNQLSTDNHGNIDSQESLGVDDLENNDNNSESFSAEEDVYNIEVMENKITEELNKCDSEWEDFVCWKDGNTYYNRCYLNFAWVDEETEAAQVIDWRCVFD